MRVTVRHRIDRLADDAANIPVEAAARMVKIVRDAAIDGRDLARHFARESAGAHGKLYPRAITHDMIGPLEREYGPDPALPQGGMSFERGSRNQKPHLDLARSADLIGDSMVDDVRRMNRRLFW